jgi:hypothetical protein
MYSIAMNIPKNSAAVPMSVSKIRISGERQPGELAGLDRQPAEDDPDLRAVYGAVAGRKHRRNRQQHQAEGAQRVHVPLQDAYLGDQQKH